MYIKLANYTQTNKNFLQNSQENQGVIFYGKGF